MYVHTYVCKYKYVLINKLAFDNDVRNIMHKLNTFEKTYLKKYASFFSFRYRQMQFCRHYEKEIDAMTRKLLYLMKNTSELADVHIDFQ